MGRANVPDPIARPDPARRRIKGGGAVRSAPARGPGLLEAPERLHAALLFLARLPGPRRGLLSGERPLALPECSEERATRSRRPRARVRRPRPLRGARTREGPGGGLKVNNAISRHLTSPLLDHPTSPRLGVGLRGLGQASPARRRSKRELGGVWGGQEVVVLLHAPPAAGAGPVGSEPAGALVLARGLVRACSLLWLRPGCTPGARPRARPLGTGCGSPLAGCGSVAGGLRAVTGRPEREAS
jgi:hypothetical protein